MTSPAEHLRVDTLPPPSMHPASGFDGSKNAPPPSRQIGLDIARAVAVLGMLFAHFATSKLDEARGWSVSVARFTDGRAMPLFVVLSGAGLTLLLRSSDRPNRAVFGRAAVLLMLGLAFDYTTPIAVILQFYALFFVVALLARRLSNRWLLIASGVIVGLGALSQLHLMDHLPDGFERVSSTASGWGAIPLLLQPHVLASELFFGGEYPFFPTFAFVLLGMWIARQNLSSLRLRKGLMVVGLGMAIVGYGAGWSTASHREVDVSAEVELPSMWWEVLDAHGHSQMPAWMVGSSGVAMAVIGVSLVAGDRFRRFTLPMANVGQLALTLYVAQIALWRWPMKQWPWGFAQVQETELTALAFLACLLGCWLWRRQFRRGPLEMVLRWSGGRSVSRP